MQEIPTIDLSGWGSDESRDRTIAAAVDDACRRIGFFSITGHLVQKPLIAAMIAQVDRFFALDEDAKDNYRSPAPEVNRGYAAKRTESLALSLGVVTPPDLFEAFNVGVEGWEPGDSAYESQQHEFFAANIWPAEVPEFQPTVMAYFQAAAAQAAQLMEIFAVALDEPRSFFEAFTSHSTDTMRINRYHRAPGEDEPLDGQQRMGAHTDYGMVTVLYADSVAGLEIVGSDGQWHGYTPQPGTLLVNVGDLMAQWTNDQWKSSLHRVVPPPRQVEGDALRRSFAFFRDGNHDALIECLPACLADGAEPLYPPVLAGDHLRAKLLGPRTQQPSTAVSTAGERIAAVRASVSE